MKRGDAALREARGPAAGTPDVGRLLTYTQRLYGRVDDLPALLDLLSKTVVALLEEIDPRHAEASHVMGAAGLLSRNCTEGIFRPLILSGRPDPEELRNFVEHVGPGDSERPTGLMGWSVARRKAALRKAREWFVADRDDENDRWMPLRPASESETEEMRRASIAAYPSVRAQLAVPILDPEIRGQARPRDAFGILNVESDQLLSPGFCELLIGFGAAAAYPLRAAVRQRDLRRLTRRLSASPSRNVLATALLDATLPHLPRRARHGFVALQRSGGAEEFVVETMTTGGAREENVRAYHAGRLTITPRDGIWGEALRTRRPAYLPDLGRGGGFPHRSFYPGSLCALAIPLLSGRGEEACGLLALESGETPYAFSTQDKGFFGLTAGVAGIALAGLQEARLEYAAAVRVPALLARLKHESIGEVPEDQIVRINAICRALISEGFAFPKAAEACRLTVHILREYTSRSPRIIDVDALRTLAVRRDEHVRAVVDPAHWDA